VRLMRWGLLFYGMRPLAWAAYAKLRARNAGTMVVTGTQGKTTALRATRHLLGLPGNAWADSNSNVRGEVPWTVLRERGQQRLIPVELGDGVDSTVELARWIRIQTLILLNVGSEHLSQLTSLTSAAEQLAAVVEQVLPGGLVIANGDDPLLRDVAARRTDLSVAWFGWSRSCEVRIAKTGRTESGHLWVDLVAAGEPVHIETQLLGLHYAPVVAASTLAAMRSGISLRVIAARWATLSATPARLELMRTFRGAVMLSDDFKATPETLQVGLAEVAAWPGRRKWAVLGDLTNLPDSNIHSHYCQAAQWAAQTATDVVTTGPEWGRRTEIWATLPVRSQHAASLAAAAEIVAVEHTGEDLIYVKGCEETRIRRVSLALSGRSVTCDRQVCKIARVVCENCPDLSVSGKPGWISQD